MAGTPIDPDREARIVRLHDDGVKSLSAISRVTGANRATVRKVLLRAGRLQIVEARQPVEEPLCIAKQNSPIGEKPEPTPEPAPIEEEKQQPGRTWEEEGDSATVTYLSAVHVRTQEDAIRYGNVDTTVWYVKRWKCGAHQVNMKLRTFGENGKPIAERPMCTAQWRVSLELERIMPRPYMEAAEAIFERIRDYAPEYPSGRPRRQPANPHMFEVDCFDVHVGKLAWSPETGQNYDLKIAEKVFRTAVEELANKAAGYNVEKVLFPVGNDFYHVDNLISTTTSGTYVDADGRFAKIIETGEMAVIRAIDFLLQIAPVHVLWVPGNHDRLSSFHLMRTVAAWYRNHRDVTVDHSPRVRKYVHYGTNLIGFTHGNEERLQSLPVIMATEMPEEWAASTTREFHIGHYHTSKKTETLPVNTRDGVVIRTLRSLSATDAWHAARGFVGSTRAAEAYLMSKADGYTGHFVARARE